jgi:hypothetical protein
VTLGGRQFHIDTNGNEVIAWKWAK